MWKYIWTLFSIAILLPGSAPEQRTTSLLASLAIICIPATSSLSIPATRLNTMQPSHSSRTDCVAAAARRHKNLAGLTLDEALALLKTKASERLNDPELTMELKDFEKPHVIVGGEVGNPGKLEFRGHMTALQAVEMSGGLSHLCQVFPDLAYSADQWRRSGNTPHRPKESDCKAPVK